MALHLWTFFYGRSVIATVSIFLSCPKCYYGRVETAKLKNMPLKSVKKNDTETYPLLGLHWFEF